MEKVTQAENRILGTEALVDLRERSPVEGPASVKALKWQKAWQVLGTKESVVDEASSTEV